MPDQLSSQNGRIRPFVIAWTVVMGIMFALLIITERLSATSLGRQLWWQEWIIGVNGIWENFTALILFVSLIFYAWNILHFHSLPGKLASIFVCLFALMLLLALGEETDWGQVWFHFQTPEIVQKQTVEGAFAIHELVFDGNDFNQGANIAVHFLLISYGVILPILAFLFANIRYSLDHVRLPTPHVAFSVWAVLVLLLELDPISIALMGFPSSDLPWSLSELRETILYLLFFGAILYSTKRWKYTSNELDRHSSSARL